jgi:hypothetical protein
MAVPRMFRSRPPAKLPAGMSEDGAPLAAVRLPIMAGLLSGTGVCLSSGSLAIVLGTTLSDFLRYWGLVLQLAGFVIVAWGLVELHQRFSGGTGPIAILRRRLRQTVLRAAVFSRKLLRRPRHQVVHASAISSSTAFGALSATVTVAYGPLAADLPVEERLARLDERTRQLRDDYNRLEQDARAETRAREAGDADERAARTTALEKADNQLANLAVGGLKMEAWGVATFVIGTILGAIPDRLADWLALLS